MGTDFFERQSEARRRTKLLAPLFLAAVGATACGVVLLALVVGNIAAMRFREQTIDDAREARGRAEYMNNITSEALAEAQREGASDDVLHMLRLSQRSLPEVPEPWEWTWWWPKLWFISGGIALGVMGLAALTKSLELRGRGSSVAELVGGRPAGFDLEPKEGLSERELINVVEEMAIASGFSVPRVFVLPQERGINAFAAGTTPEEAAIAVTAGALRHLTREELQAVVAHEFSHLLHGDARLNQRMIAVVFGIASIGMIGSGLINAAAAAAEDDEKPGSLLGLAVHPVPLGVMLCAASLAVIGGIGLAVGRVIQAATNRQREYLADASAVQFTRNPAALASALKKIGGLRRGGRLRSQHGVEIAHMCIAAPGYTLLDTHPPLADRIRRLEPDFGGTFPEIIVFDAEVARRLVATQERVRRELAERRRETMALRQARTLFAADVVAAAGSLSAAGLAAAQEVLEDLPEALREAAHDPAGAEAIVLGLAPAVDEGARRRQLEAAGEVEIGIAARADALRGELSALRDEHRLPLLDIALPALEPLDESARRRLVEALRAAVQADDSLSLRELCYVRIVEHHLLPREVRRRPVYSVAAIRAPVAVVLAGLATLCDDPATAYQVGISRLKLRRLEPPFAPPTPLAFDAALEELSTASPAVLRRVLDAAAYCVASDGRICPAEHETLRALAAAMRVPLPPMVAAARSVAREEEAAAR